MIKFAIGSIAVVFLVVASLGIATRLAIPRNDASTHPSDRALIENFRRHEAEFNKLIGMSRVDSRVIRIAEDFTWLDNNASWPRPDSDIGFSVERWNEYRHAFQVLGLKKGLMRPLDTDAVFLIASSTGAVPSGSSKGYVYSTKPLSPLSDSLDEIPHEFLSQHAVYKKLGNDWYLFFQGN
jgi:hypothetical protein